MKGLIYQKYKKIVMPHGIHGKIQQSTQKRQNIVTFNQTDIIYHTLNVCWEKFPTVLVFKYLTWSIPVSMPTHVQFLFPFKYIGIMLHIEF